MAELNIENASIGYDVDGLKTALSNIHSEVIQKAIDTINSSWKELDEKVSQFMVGQAAVDFRYNMLDEKSIVQKGMEDCYAVLQGEVYEIVNALAKLDDELVAPRN